MDAFTKVLHTLTEMLGDRGYDVTPLNDRDGLLRIYGDGSLFSVTLSLSLSTTTASNDGQKPTMRVVFFPQAQLKMEIIRKAFDGPADYLLVIHSADKLKPNVRNAAEEIRGKLQATGHTLQVFAFKELETNIMRHVYQPRFERLTGTALATMFADHGLTPERASRQLHHIKSDDKVARFMGLKPGDVVKITRASPSVGNSDTYRVCVPA